MRGLTWNHIWWMAASTYLLIATITSDRPYTLNHDVAVKLWGAIAGGGPSLYSAQKEAAHRLDKFSSERWPEAASSCVTTPNNQSPLTKQQLAKLNLIKPKDRAALSAIIGIPYCQKVSGSEIWQVEDSEQILEAEYNPIRYGLSSKNPGSVPRQSGGNSRATPGSKK